MHDRESASLPPRDKVPTRTYRYAAYRQFMWWVHNHLGRRSETTNTYLMNKIRDTFLEPSNVCVGFNERGEESS